MGSEDLQGHHAGFVEKLREIDDEAWMVMEHRRFQTQLKNVTKKSRNDDARRTGIKKPKSAARQEAGKSKVASLISWQQDVRAAKNALAAEGYQGSLKLAKGMPMHQKTMELQKARATSVSAASSQ